ncbi:MAG: SOS response-associated peptidase family protein [Kofleriaceae bacterium]
MVERYSLSSLDEVAGLFGPGAELVPRFNIAPLQRAPIRTAAGLALARWGLLPPWRGHGGKRGPHVPHAPLDELDATPLLRNAFTRQRCLVLADGFFVWRRTGKKPQPMWLHPTPDPARPLARSRLVALAGIAATHKDDHEPSFAILVGPANPLVAAALAPGVATGPIAPRVVPAESFARWLDGPRAQARALLAAPELGWRADPVSTWVNSVDHDDATCVEPLGNPAQGQLF